MKNLIFSLSLLVACMAALSCNKDGDDQQCDSDGDCFTATVGGESFVSDNVTGTLVFFGGLSIGATAGKTDPRTFGLVLTATTAGTYTFGSGDVAATYSPAALSSSVIFSASSGSLTISQHDTAARHISGSFSFEGADAEGNPVEVTDGSFDLTYQ